MITKKPAALFTTFSGVLDHPGMHDCRQQGSAGQASCLAVLDLPLRPRSDDAYLVVLTDELTADGLL